VDPRLPHDRLIPAIARELADAGEYSATFLSADAQRLVDLRWAALRAGRLIGRPVRVSVSRAAVDPGSTPITVRLTCAPATKPAIPLQRQQGT
jgi:hypothetical protein